MATPRKAGRICACGRELEPRMRKQCRKCQSHDPHRHRARKMKVEQMFVSVDCEGVPDDDGIMQLASMSYGREDGTSASVTAAEGEYLAPTDALLWLVNELAGHYTDSTGREWRQAAVAFHFGWDTAVIGKAFADDMILVHKSTAKERGLLCWTSHRSEEERYDCKQFHRDDEGLIQDIITEGGEGDLLALHTPTGIAIATSHKRRFYVEHRPNGDRFDGVRRVDIHDTGSAFVGGLLKVIEKWQPPLSAEQNAAIEWGKAARRHGFLHATREQIETYSEAECVAHARVCRQLLEAIRESVNIMMEPADLYGSGSVAAAAFKYHRVTPRDYTTVGDEMVRGLRIDDIARMTYFGGMIETPALGMFSDPVDEVDINSAYPSHAIKLPCMATDHGEWATFNGWWDDRMERWIKPETLGHVLVSWFIDEKRCVSTPPFMVRDRHGLVRSPLSGERVWVTLPEFLAARAQFGDDVVPHETVWWIQDCNCDGPLAWLSDVYDHRQAIKAEMRQYEDGSNEWNELNAKQEALKLIINSAYGKTAQQRPDYGRWTNLHWASYITGATRAQVRLETWLRESQGGTVVYQHTDSVLSIGGAPADGGKGLGAGGMEHQSIGLVIVQPGLAVSLEHGKAATRGVSLDEFTIAVRKWVVDNDFTKSPDKWNSFSVDRQMMVTRRMAAARGKPWLAGSFVPMPQTLRFRTTGKRDFANSTPISGNPGAWRVPPILAVAEPATLDDLKDYQSRLTRLIKAGEFDLTEL